MPAGENDREEIGAPPRGTSRDPEATASRIVAAAEREFCDHGFSGARIDRICAAAGVSARMIYHYFGNKEGLYLEVLETIYMRVRGAEARLDLAAKTPPEAMAALLEFTFDHLIEHPEFVRIVMGENLLHARYLRRSAKVPQATQPLLQNIRSVLARGQAEGCFRQNIDPVQLYVTILSLSLLHLSNKHTLSVMFARDLGDAAWLAERRRHVREVVLKFLAPNTHPAASHS